MRAQNIIPLYEQKLMEGRRILRESCEGLTTEQQIVVEGVYNEFLPLIEATLKHELKNPNAVIDLFQKIEDGVTAGGGNRTAIGKGKDVAKMVSDTLTKAAKWLQDTAPVKAFDQKFEDLKAKVAEKLGGDDSKIVQYTKKLGELAIKHPGKTACIIGVLTALASLAGGPMGGAIAGQVLRGTVELLKGEKLSTAIGKGIKTAAFGYLTGAALKQVGEWITGIRIEQLSLKDHLKGSGINRYIVRFPPNASRFDGVENLTPVKLTLFDHDADEIRKLAKILEEPLPRWSGLDSMVADKLGMAKMMKAQDAYHKIEQIIEKSSSESYEKLFDEIGNEAKEMIIQNDKAYQTIKKATKIVSAVAQGGASAATMNEPKEKTQESINPFNEMQMMELFEAVEQQQILTEGPIWDKVKDTAKGAASKVADTGKKIAGAAVQKIATKGKNITTKITADKLMQKWKKAGKPMTSNLLYKFLINNGVQPDVIKPAFKQMELKQPAYKSLKKQVDELDINNAKQFDKFYMDLSPKQKASLLKIGQSIMGMQPA